jgi:DNA-directed RNA polymerase II subunit RPB3
MILRAQRRSLGGNIIQKEVGTQRQQIGMSVHIHHPRKRKRTTNGTLNREEVSDLRIEDSELRILEVTPRVVRFDWFNVDVGMANGLRRAMMGDVPTIAIEIVEIESNQTVLDDQFVSHRLGLFPLRSNDVQRLTTYGKCTECSGAEWCPACCIELEMDVQNVEAEVRAVTALDLRRSNRQIEYDRKQGLPDCEMRRVVCGNTPDESVYLLDLAKNQHLRLRALARKGTSSEHAKWSPVCDARFQWNRHISVNRAITATMTLDQKRQIVNSCPVGVFKLTERGTVADDGGGIGGDIDIEDADACTSCRQCTLTADELECSGALKIELKPDKFTFHVETTGVMDPLLVVDLGLAALSERMKRVDTCLAELEEQSVDK